MAVHMQRGPAPETRAEAEALAHPTAQKENSMTDRKYGAAFRARYDSRGDEECIECGQDLSRGQQVRYWYQSAGHRTLVHADCRRTDDPGDVLEAMNVLAEPDY